MKKGGDFPPADLGGSLGGRRIDIERERKKKRRILRILRGRERSLEGKRKEVRKRRVEKSEDTKTSGDFLTGRKCFQVCLL